MKTTRAFILIELLVVLAIIAILAGLLTSVLASTRRVGDRAHAMSNLRQMGLGAIHYASEHDSDLPAEGETLPTWESAALPENANAWYIAIPRALGTRGVGDFAENPEAFYARKNLLFIPAAQYPEKRKDRPYFAVSMNSKLRDEGVADGSVRLVNTDQPARTVIFQESGLPGEEPLPGQSPGAYEGRASGYASQTVARYSRKCHLVFADGHVELLAAHDVVDSNGRPIFHKSPTRAARFSGRSTQPLTQMNEQPRVPSGLHESARNPCTASFIPAGSPVQRWRASRAGRRSNQCTNRAYFFSVAAEAMRCILIDAARREARPAARRSGQPLLVRNDKPI